MHRFTLRPDMRLHTRLIAMAAIVTGVLATSAEAQIAYFSGTYSQNFQTFLTVSGSSQIIQRQMHETPPWPMADR